MKVELVSIPRSAIENLLAKKGREWSNSHYEVILAALLCEFTEGKLGERCAIGIEVQDRYRREIPKNGAYSLDQIETLFLRQIKQDSSVDVWVTCKSGVVGYQLKRWGIFDSGRNTQELIDYLNGLSEKYAPTNAKLVVVLESDEELDTRLIVEKLRTNRYPFTAIMFAVSSGGEILIGEFWPNPGYDSFPIKSE